LIIDPPAGSGAAPESFIPDVAFNLNPLKSILKLPPKRPNHHDNLLQ